MQKDELLEKLKSQSVEVPVLTNYIINEEQQANVLSTCIEGGSTYWAVFDLRGTKARSKIASHNTVGVQQLRDVRDIEVIETPVHRAYIGEDVGYFGALKDHGINIYDQETLPKCKNFWESAGAKRIGPNCPHDGTLLTLTEFQNGFRLCADSSYGPSVIERISNSDYDINDADYVLQFALFGEIVFC